MTSFEQNEKFQMKKYEPLAVLNIIDFTSQYSNMVMYIIYIYFLF